MARGALVVSILLFSDFHNRWGADVAENSSDYHLTHSRDAYGTTLNWVSKPPPDRFAAYPYSPSENFMFGLPGSDDEDKIFLIDFGLSSRSVTTAIYSGRIVAQGYLEAFRPRPGGFIPMARCVACGPWLRM